MTIFHLSDEHYDAHGPKIVCFNLIPLHVMLPYHMWFNVLFHLLTQCISDNTITYLTKGCIDIQVTIHKGKSL